MNNEMKDVEQIHKDWDYYKSQDDPGPVKTQKAKYNRRNKTWFAVTHLDMVIYQYYEQKEYIALLEKQVKDPTFLRDVDAYRPKDRTERQAFMTLWCERCKAAKNACSGYVALMVLTEDGQEVEGMDDVFCLPNGQPTCTAFEVEE